MKKIAIIGANNFQNPLILKAKELGYETHVFAWKDGSIGEKTADYFYPISVVEKDAILQKCKEINIDAIVTIGSEVTVKTVNYVAEKMELIGNSLICNEKATNKFKMRSAFKEHNVATPKFEVVEENDNLDKIKNMEFPLIVKPTDGYGSKAITKIYEFSELQEAINKATQNSFEKKAIVEEYIDGEEFSIEGITYNGKHQFLAITKKFTTGAPNFIETGHIQPADISQEMKNKIYEEISKALDALEVKNSASHSEFKITKNGRVRIIEIGARMGGDCIGSDLVQLSTGYDYIKMVIDVATGNKPDFNRICEPKFAAIKFIFNENDLKDFEKIKTEHPEFIVRTSEFEDINSHKVIDSSSRFGFYILACDDIEKIRWLFNDKG